MRVVGRRALQLGAAPGTVTVPPGTSTCGTGVELSGPFADADTVRSAILAAGERHGLLRGGTRASFSSVVETGNGRGAVRRDLGPAR